MPPPNDIERVDDLVKRNEVTEAKTEPESVALQRLKNESKAHSQIIYISAGTFLLLMVFLMAMYMTDGTSDEAKNRILFGLTGAISAALGVFAPKEALIESRGVRVARRNAWLWPHFVRYLR